MIIIAVLQAIGIIAAGLLIGYGIIKHFNL